MDITRYIRKDQMDKTGRCQIYFRVCWSGQKVRFSSGQLTPPEEWIEVKEIVTDPVTRRRSVRSVMKSMDSRLNRKLDAILNGIDDFFRNFPGDPEPDQVKAEVIRLKAEIVPGSRVRMKLPQPELPEKEVEPPPLPGLVAFLWQYREDVRASHSKSTGQHISAIANHFEAFRRGIDWADLRINTLNQMKAYWAEELSLADNSIASYYGSFRGAMKYAQKSGFPVPPDFLWVSAKPVQVSRPSLQQHHLDRLETLKMEVPKGVHTSQRFLWISLIETQWLFLMACYTGLRYSDLAQANRSNVRIVDGYPCLMALQQKSAPPVAIPLIEKAVQLLDERPGGIKPPVEINDYNRHLKQVSEMAGLTEIVTVSSRYKQKLIHDNIPLWQVMSSHTARRTFGSLLTEGGLPTRTLQELMGHVSITNTQKYQRLSNPIIIRQMVQAWERAGIWKERDT